jgi:hypothetical protein
MGAVDGVGDGVTVFMEGAMLVDTDGGGMPASPTRAVGRGNSRVSINIAATAAARMNGSDVPRPERGVL